jgi:hypothetical protein
VCPKQAASVGIEKSQRFKSAQWVAAQLAWLRFIDVSRVQSTAPEKMITIPALAKTTLPAQQKKGNQKMATAKKAAPKAAANPKVKTPAKVVKPAAKPAAKKAPVSKTAKAIAKLSSSIAKLTERKDKINAEINVLREQRTALKAAPAMPASAAPKVKAKVAAKAAPKAAAPVKAVKRAARK